MFNIQTRSPFNHDFILKSSVCSEKSLNSHQYSLKHCPASKDSQFYWTCILTDLCGFGWQTHPTRKAESLPRLCYLTTKSKPTFLPHDGLWWRMDVLPRWRGGTNWPEFYAGRYRKYMQCSWLQTRYIMGSVRYRAAKNCREPVFTSLLWTLMLSSKEMIFKATDQMGSNGKISVIKKKQ